MYIGFYGAEQKMEDNEILIMFSFRDNRKSEYCLNSSPVPGIYLSRYVLYMHKYTYKYMYLPELGTSLFEIALSLFALERTLILGAMALLETKSEAL